MKVLVFHIGPDRYALRLKVLVRVLPLLALKRLPLAPAHVAGLMDLAGAAVPVIDLCRLAGVAPAADFYDTRILLVDYTDPHGAVHPLGLLAQQVRGIRALAPEAFSDSGVTVAGAAFLGQVASDADGMLQLIELDQLLPPALRDMLFQAAAPALPAEPLP